MFTMCHVHATGFSLEQRGVGVLLRAGTTCRVRMFSLKGQRFRIRLPYVMSHWQI